MKKLSKPAKITIILSSFIVLLCVSFILLVKLMNTYTFGKSYSKVVEHADDVQQYEANILADLVLLDANPVFAAPTFDKDATPYLEKYVPWVGRGGVSPTVLAASQSLLDKHTQFKTKEDVEALFADAELMQIDVSWLDELIQYDHISLAGYPGVKPELEKMMAASSLERINIYSELPSPHFKDLTMAALIRFFQLNQKNEAEKGFKLVRHISGLFNTVPSLLGPVYAHRLLSLEEPLRQISNFTNWLVVDEKRLVAYKSVSWVWPSLLDQYVWGKHFNTEIEKYMKPQNGLCAVAGERALGIGFYDYLEPSFFFEADFSQEVAKSREITKTLFEKCHMQAYNFLLTSAQVTKSIFPQNTPYVRRIIAMDLLAIATPSFMKPYVERANGK